MGYFIPDPCPGVVTAAWWNLQINNIRKFHGKNGVDPAHEVDNFPAKCVPRTAAASDQGHSLVTLEIQGTITNDNPDRQIIVVTKKRTLVKVGFICKAVADGGVGFPYIYLQRTRDGTLVTVASKRMLLAATAYIVVPPVYLDLLPGDQLHIKINALGGAGVTITDPHITIHSKALHTT